MSEKYREYKNLDMPAIEQEYLKLWDEGDVFAQSVSGRADAESFIFYEGPPSANGMPGIHHVIARTLKDLVCRYKTMRGYQVQRKAGWDTHGLPVELGVEKELGITKEDIGVTISVEEYNRKCREAVLQYKDKWDELTRKMGYWVDLENPYVTFENDYIESLWWCLKQLFDKDYLYKSISIQPYSPAAGTGLSSHELNQPGTYKQVKDTTVTAMFRAVEDAQSRFLFDASGNKPVYFMAWTTTPWTLPANCALTVGPAIKYCLVRTLNPYTREPVHVILAEALLHGYFREEYRDADPASSDPADKNVPWTVVGTWPGSELTGCRYEQLLPFEGNSREKAGGDPWRVIPGDFVTTEDGTGIVHTAPAFGADDYKTGKQHNVGILITVSREGKFVEEMGWLSGRYVKNYKDDPEFKDPDVDIAVGLKLEGNAFRVEKYEHSYPHCWRTDKPVIYYPLDAWFIRTTAVRERMIELNRTINWKPKSTGEGRFGNWLENVVDWNLSRSRYWGTPLPVWATEDGSEYRCIGSVEELIREAGHAAEVLGISQQLERGELDLHKPYVDQIILVSKDGRPMRREPDLIDVWFDSGAMPYAQWHYPFENEAAHTRNFPADFIAEGVDQTRGWFYTLHALGVMLFDSVAYKTVISNGLVLDKNGNKMSKRLGNAIDPFETINKYSADATRWYLITNAAPWDSLRFDIEGIREVQRKFFGTLFNTYQFFALYANLDGFSFKEARIPLQDRPEIDRWIISSLNSLAARVTRAMDEYEPTQAGRAISEFVDEQLSNWYVRLCRRRFWKGAYEHDKICAYQTLYECLETISRLMAPVAPFFADWLYRNLNTVTGRIGADSVHLADFPVPEAEAADTALEERMRMAQDISSLILSLRKKVRIKVRQPLQKVLIPVIGEEMKEQLDRVSELIRNEVNVKEIEYISGDNAFISKKVKLHFKLVGGRVGAAMKALVQAVDALTQPEIASFEQAGQFRFEIDGKEIILARSEVEIIADDIPGWSIANKDNMTVALDITVTPELEQEGHARELVNRIQKIRKEEGFDVTDRIAVGVVAGEPLKTAIINYNDYICTEILADRIEILPQLSAGMEVEVNESVLKVLISKI